MTSEPEGANAMPELTAAVRDNVGPIAYLTERFGAAYYGGDPEWGRWLADIRAACARLDEAEAAEARRNSHMAWKEGLRTIRNSPAKEPIAVTDEMVERAAEAACKCDARRYGHGRDVWGITGPSGDITRAAYRESAREALIAALRPESI